MTSRKTRALFGALLLGATALVAASGSWSATTKAPVSVLVHKNFGRVLATPKKQALYYWKVEKADFKVHCTGACAKAWPPLIVKARSAVPARVAGIKGKFGVIRRPDGRLQVTHNRLPVYTYAHEGPGQVLCDNVNGWFVVRL